MSNIRLCLLGTAVALALSVPSFASPVTVPCPGGVCTATITTPNLTYTLTTYDDGTNYYNTFQTSAANALDFANIYFDTDTGTPQDNGSNLGFEITNYRAFIPTNNPGPNPYYPLAGTGVTFTDTLINGTRTISLVTPNSFFLNDPTGIPFQHTAPGGEVTVHYSQAFDYTFVGGSDNYSLPNELGGATINAASPVPEPSSLMLLGTGIAGLAGAARRRFARR